MTSFRARLLLALVLLDLSLTACSRSAFDQSHRRAIAENPPGVELEIRTRGEKEQFSVSEPVEFEELYTSKYSGLWHIEVFESTNAASNPISDLVHIADGNSTLDQPRELWVGTVCCNSRHVWLNQEPVRIPYKLGPGRWLLEHEGWPNPEWHILRLPNKSGNYRVYLTTHRVFWSGDNKNALEDRGRPVSSNILKLQVK